MKNIKLFFLCLILIIPSYVFGVTIATEKIGYVDLEKIFNEYPGAESAKKEVETKKETLKKNVEDKKNNINSLQENYDVTISSIAYYKAEQTKEQNKPVAVEAGSQIFSLDNIEKDTSTLENVSSTTTVKSSETVKPSISMDYEKIISELSNKQSKLEKQIKEEKNKLDTFTDDREKEIKELEDKYSYNILGEVYDIILAVALEQGCSVVIDKNNVLYGSDINDLTPLVIKKIKK
jgi:Skp family chaperone for outer membrane proteins